MIPAVVFRRYGDDHGAVGILSRPAVVAHPVDGEHARLGRCIYHVAARAHAERINAPAVLQLFRQLVCSCGKRAPVRPSVRVPVDQRLRVLHADAHRERLGFHVHASFIQHLKGVSCAVSGCEHGRVRPDPLSVIQDQTARLRDHIRHLCVEPEFPARTDNGFPHLLHHVHEDIRPDVRFLLPQDVLRRPEADECLQHKTVPPAAVFHKRVKLPV